MGSLREVRWFTSYTIWNWDHQKSGHVVKARRFGSEGRFNCCRLSLNSASRHGARGGRTNWEHDGALGVGTESSCVRLFMMSSEDQMGSLGLSQPWSGGSTQRHGECWWNRKGRPWQKGHSRLHSDLPESQWQWGSSRHQTCPWG